MNDQIYHITKDKSGATKKFVTPNCKAPIPAAKLERTTTAPACTVAFLSFSTSSYKSGSILIALSTRFKKI